MNEKRSLRRIFQKIQVVRPPKHRLATFGTSRIDYLLVTDVPGLPDRSRLRRGVVTAEKPTLITGQALREQFRGFSHEAKKYVDSLISHYGEAMRGLEYNFQNEPVSSRVELIAPDPFILQLAKDHDQRAGFNEALIRGTDQLWELSLMKFIIEETMASFQSNIRELKEHGFMEEDRISAQRHREVDFLFRTARKDRQVIPRLAAKLKEYDFFDQYQDAFFKLVNQ